MSFSFVDSGQLTESDENTEPSGWIVSLLNAAENLTGSYSDIAQHCQEVNIKLYITCLILQCKVY